MTSRYPIPQPDSNSRIQRAREILDPYEGLDLGNDDFIFGSYVEWPELESIDDDQLDELLAAWNINFSSKALEDYTVDVAESASAEEVIKSLFRAIAIQKLRESRFPEGIVFEADMGGEYPDDMKYWSDPLAEYEYLATHPLPHETYLTRLDEIRRKFEETSDILTKHSLILLALGHAEHYEKSTILRMWEDKQMAVNELLDTKELTKIAFSRLHSVENRSRAYKLLTGKPLSGLPRAFHDLRNTLAHSPADSNMQDVDSGPRITYLDSKHHQKSLPISEIFETLQQYDISE